MARSSWLNAVLILIGFAMSIYQAVQLVPDAPAPVPAPVVVEAPVEAPAPPTPAVIVEQVPREARSVLEAISRGGPYAHSQDDGIFQNRERALPARERGYYREYTVETPGSPDRGARRIITGGQPPTEFFYTDDHYASFRAFDPTTGALR